MLAKSFDHKYKMAEDGPPVAPARTGSLKPPPATSLDRDKRGKLFGGGKKDKRECLRRPYVCVCVCGHTKGMHPVLC